MCKLLKFEFHKLKRQKSFYICTIVMIALLFLSAMTSKVLVDKSPELALQFNNSGISSMVSAVSNSSFILIAGIFVALLICDDYEQQTIKNIYGRGYSRVKVYFSKLITVLVATTVMFVLVTLGAFAFGCMYFGVGEAVGYYFLKMVAVQYITCMANISFFFAISGVLRKTGSSIAAIIVAPMIVNMVLGLADSFLKLEEFSFTSLWLSSFINDLSALTVTDERMLVCLIASLIYIPIFAIVGLFFNKRIEL